MSSVIEVRIVILHPNLDDVLDHEKIQQAATSIFSETLLAFVSAEGEQWEVDSRFPDTEGPTDAEVGPHDRRLLTRRHTKTWRDKIIFRRRVDELSGIILRTTIQALCDSLFREGDRRSLESIRNGRNLLFRPVIGTGNPRVNRVFSRCFVLGMTRRRTNKLIFGNIRTVGSNTLSRNLVDWLKGSYVCYRCTRLSRHVTDGTRSSMSTVASVADCQPGLDEFTQLIPPGTWSSENPDATRYTSVGVRPPNEIESIKMEKALDIISSAIPEKEDLKQENILIRPLDKAELCQAINNSTDLLDLNIDRLSHALQDLLDGYATGNGTPQPARIATVLDQLQYSIEQAGQIHEITEKERPVHETARKRWGCGTLGLALLTVGAISCPIAAAPVASGLLVLGTGGATAGCGYKTYRHHNDSNISNTVYLLDDKLRSLWLFLSLFQLRANGLNDDDPHFLQFEARMAAMFNITDLVGNWNDPDYMRSYIQSSHKFIKKEIRTLINTIEGRCQSLNPNIAQENGNAAGDEQNAEAHMLADQIYENELVGEEDAEVDIPANQMHGNEHLEEEDTDTSVLDYLTVSTRDMDYAGESSTLISSTLYADSWESLSTLSESFA